MLFCMVIWEGPVSFCIHVYHRDFVDILVTCFLVQMFLFCKDKVFWISHGSCMFDVLMVC